MARSLYSFVRSIGPFMRVAHFYISLSFISCAHTMTLGRTVRERKNAGFMSSDNKPALPEIGCQESERWYVLSFFGRQLLAYKYLRKEKWWDPEGVQEHSHKVTIPRECLRTHHQSLFYGFARITGPFINLLWFLFIFGQSSQRKGKREKELTTGQYKLKNQEIDGASHKR